MRRSRSHERTGITECPRNLFPVDEKTLTKKQRAYVVASMIFLKENYNGDIKERVLVDGKKH